MLFLPTPLAVAWVFRWTFSSSPSYQLFVYLRYRKRCGGGGAWVLVLGCVCHLVYYRGNKIIWVLCTRMYGGLRHLK